MVLSDDMTSLKQENQIITDPIIRAENIPYTRDSSVMGFPLLKYPSIVAPSCTNNTLIPAANNIKGTMYSKLNFRAFLPFNLREYTKAPVYESSKIIGFSKKTLVPITTMKNKIFRIGW